MMFRKAAWENDIHYPWGMESKWDTLQLIRLFRNSLSTTKYLQLKLRFPKHFSQERLIFFYILFVQDVYDIPAGKQKLFIFKSNSKIELQSVSKFNKWPKFWQIT